MRIYYPIKQVECYAGYRGEEEPRSFTLNEKKVKVKDIIDRWLDPHYRYFKVMGSEGGMYMLRHDVKSWKWEAAILSHGEFNQ